MHNMLNAIVIFFCIWYCHYFLINQFKILFLGDRKKNHFIETILLSTPGADPGFLDRGFKFTKGGSIC